jgi:hypothetical protein
MKAKIISTGEIINIADYARVTLDKCDDYGNPIEVPFEDIELIKDSSSNINWQQVRIQAAISAMQGILGDYEYVQEINCASPDAKSMRESMAKLSVLYADALVKELKGE